MFVSEEIRVPVSFHVAAARLANLIHGGRLLRASHDAYRETATRELRVGPVPHVSRLVRAQFRDLVTRGDSAVLAFRWEATGPGGKLFPVLDADMTLSPEGPTSTLLRLNATYRAPLGTAGSVLDQTVLHTVASATIRSFLGRFAALIEHPEAERGPIVRPGVWEIEPDAT